MTAALHPLPRSFYDRDPVLVARDLLGQRVVRMLRGTRLSGRIVETEAYLPVGDPANHASRGPTPRNAAMFGPPGHAYVYSIHARFCLNAVTQGVGVASAVLIRALEPLEGLNRMRRHRGREDVRDLTRGPARLCEALDVDRTLDGWDLTRGMSLWIAAGEDCPAKASITAGPRIGVRRAADLPLRFALTDSRFLSRPA